MRCYLSSPSQRPERGRQEGHPGRGGQGQGGVGPGQGAEEHQAHSQDVAGLQGEHGPQFLEKKINQARYTLALT